MEPFLFKDTRTSKDFGDKTFSGYKKTDVVQEFKKALLQCEIEKAIHWSIELLSCGEVQKIYDNLHFIIFKKIGIENPKLPHCFYRRYSFLLKLRAIYDPSKKTKVNKSIDLQLRNNNSIRTHICELIVLCCESKKENTSNCVKIKKSEFSGDFIKTKVKATEYDYLRQLRRKGDSDEVALAMNELIYAIKNKNCTDAIYWISWVLEWDLLLLKNGMKLMCSPRDHIYVKTEQNDIVWFIWEIILHEGKRLQRSIQVQIHSLFQLYKYDWTPTKKKSRAYLMIIGLQYIIKMYSMKLELSLNIPRLLKTCASSSLYMSKIQKHEIVDYNATMWKLENVKTRDKIIPTKEERNLTSKQREKKKKEKLVKKSEEKIWTVYKLDSQMN